MSARGPGGASSSGQTHERRPLREETASEVSLPATTTTVRHPGGEPPKADTLPPLAVPYRKHRHRRGCRHGCELTGPHDHDRRDVRDGLVDRAPCSGRCWAADLVTLQYWGDRHGCCPCLLEAAS